jgi:hypothetical protein
LYHYPFIIYFQPTTQWQERGNNPQQLLLGGLMLTCAGACVVEERKQVVHRELLGIMQLRKDEYFQYLRHSRSSAVPSNLNKSTPPHTLAHTAHTAHSTRHGNGE